jgi:ABC-type branched-subunit amino acid transport system substrate-binding protein
MRAFAGLLMIIAVGVIGNTANAAERVSIGMIGPISRVGEEQIRGATLAIRQASGKPKIEFLTSDDACNPEVGASKAREWIDREKLVLLIGGTCTNVARAIGGVANEKGVPFISLAGLEATGQSVTSARFVFPLGLEPATARTMTEGLQNGLNIDAGLGWCSVSFMLEKGNSAGTSGSARPRVTVCPVLSIDESRWNKFFTEFSDAFGRNRPDATAALGFAAAQIAVKAIEASDGTPAGIARHLRTAEFDTMLGKASFSKSNPFGIFLAAFPQEDRSGALQKLLASSSSENKKKCTDCKKSGDCPQGSYRDIVMAKDDKDCCKKSTDCPQGSLLMMR